MRAVPVTNLKTSPINAAPPISEVQGGEGEVIPQTSGDLVEEVGDGNHGSGEDTNPTTTVDGSTIYIFIFLPCAGLAPLKALFKTLSALYNFYFLHIDFS